MQTFLTKVEILNGDKASRDWGLIEAENLGQAEAIAQIQVDKDNSGDWVDPDSKYWVQTGSGMLVRLRTTEPIDDDEAQVLLKYGIAYYINK